MAEEIKNIENEEVMQNNFILYGDGFNSVG